MTTAKPQPRLSFWLFGILFSLLGLTSAFVLCRLNLPGTIDRDATAYCESSQIGWLHQPANSLANLAFFWSGAAIVAGIGRRRSALRTPLQSPSVQRWGLALGSASIGFGSLWFHSTLTTWGGIADNFAMNLFATQMLVYSWERTFRWSLERSAVTLISLNLALDTLVITYDIGKYLFGAVVALVIATELSIVCKRSWLGLVGETLNLRVRYFARNPWLFLGTVSVFVPGALVWQQSRTGTSLCHPESWMQGHAFWHLSSAAAVWLNFLYFDSEFAISANGLGSRALLPSRDVPSIRGYATSDAE